MQPFFLRRPVLLILGIVIATAAVIIVFAAFGRNTPKRALDGYPLQLQVIVSHVNSASQVLVKCVQSR